MLREIDVARKYYRYGGLPLVLSGAYFRVRNLLGIPSVRNVPKTLNIEQRGITYEIPVSDQDDLEKWLQHERNIVQPEVKCPMRELLSHGDRFVDVGAYNGDTSVYAHSLVGPSGSVVAFDPDPKPLETFREIIRRNGLDNIRIENAAVSDTSGEQPAVKVLGQTRAEFVGAEAKEMEISSIELDAYLNEKGIEPNLVKIDVDGAEFAALRGAEDTIGDCPIILELHHSDLLDEWTETVEFVLEHANSVLYLGAQGLEPNSWDYREELTAISDFDPDTVTNILIT